MKSKGARKCSRNEPSGEKLAHYLYFKMLSLEFLDSIIIQWFRVLLQPVPIAQIPLFSGPKTGFSLVSYPVIEGEGNHSTQEDVIGELSAHWFVRKNTPASHQLVGSGSHDRFLQSLYVSIFSARQHLFSMSASFQYWAKIITRLIWNYVAIDYEKK